MPYFKVIRHNSPSIHVIKENSKQSIYNSISFKAIVRIQGYFKAFFLYFFLKLMTIFVFIFEQSISFKAIVRIQGYFKAFFCIFFEAYDNFCFHF